MSRAGTSVTCVSCRAIIPADAGLASVVDGAVIVQCGDCQRGVTAAAEPAAEAARHRWWRNAGIALAVVGIASAMAVPGRPAPSVVPVAVADVHAAPMIGPVASLSSLSPRSGGRVREEGEVALDDEAAPAPPPIPERRGEPLDVWFPTLRDWVHPVVAAEEQIPVKRTRSFGALREGRDRAECGQGHCGVDLAGNVGQPVVAVAWGTVARIVRSEEGRDGRSGRYVRLEHPDHVFTSYMHLDRIADGLEVGDEIAAGQQLGTVGTSGIHRSLPHLHFGLEIPERGALTFIDPTPFLQRAIIRRVADRRPARPPQW